MIRKRIMKYYMYDLQTDQESILATHTAWPDVSGSIVMWGNVQGYDLSKGTPIQIKNLHGKPQRPRISGQWVIYLDVSNNDDTPDVYAHHLTTNEDFKIGTMPMLGPRAIGTVEWYRHDRLVSRY